MERDIRPTPIHKEGIGSIFSIPGVEDVPPPVTNQGGGTWSWSSPDDTWHYVPTPPNDGVEWDYDENGVAYVKGIIMREREL